MIKKYKVLKKTPKPIMNAGRLIMLDPDKMVYLKHEKQVMILESQGYIQQVKEDHKPEKKEEVKQEEVAKDEPKEEKSEFEHKSRSKKWKKKKQQPSEQKPEEQIDQE